MTQFLFWKRNISVMSMKNFKHLYLFKHRKGFFKLKKGEENTKYVRND